MTKRQTWALTKNSLATHDARYTPGTSTGACRSLARMTVDAGAAENRRVMEQENGKGQAPGERRQPQPVGAGTGQQYAAQCRYMEQDKGPSHRRRLSQRAPGMAKADPCQHGQNQPAQGADRQCVLGQARLLQPAQM